MRRVALVRHALRRSDLRVRILRALHAQPASCIAEIASAVGADWGNVAGALRGKGRRYSARTSLVALDLVAPVDDSDGLFWLTEDGREALAEASQPTRTKEATNQHEPLHHARPGIPAAGAPGVC